MKQRIVLAVIGICFTMLAGQHALAQDQGKESVRVRGSESMARLADGFAQDFMKDHPQSSVIVSGGMDAGFQALFNKECEVAMASRKIKAEEKEEAVKKGLDLEEKIVGWGGIVILAHPSNPLNELTVDQVRKIFTGETSNWSQVGGPNEAIAVLAVGENRPGTIEFFTEQVLKAPIAQGAVSKKHFRSIIAAASEQPNATGYARVRNMEDLKEKGLESKVKALAIKKTENSPAVMPTRETVNNGSYPITRPYYMYMDRKTAGQATKSYFDFCGNKLPKRLASE
ncbi:MAG TPA: PstS family phosphate ABC transporter substrate-binding protein [Desulfomonilaceae bacterium]|nr:PstS family phosphate ABC transporter substrate-binding protein [Desulfomonilaceae bacterium]